MKIHIQKEFFLYIFTILISVSGIAQPTYQIVEYSTEDGLSQNTVMEILQDKKGYMWFATWNGLSRFDGYDFSAFRVTPGDNVSISSSRIDRIFEDYKGNIWCITYSGDILVFQNKTEQFRNIKISELGMKNQEFPISDIKTLPDSSILLISENKGLIKLSYEDDEHFNKTFISHENELLYGRKIYKVFADKYSNIWILTENGISIFDKEKDKMIHYLQNRTSNSNAFYSYSFGRDEILLGSDKGKIWIYNEDKFSFEQINLPTESNLKKVCFLNDSTLFAATSNDGFFTYNKNNKSSKHYNVQNTPNLKKNEIIHTYMSKAGHVWIQSRKQGISQFIPQRDTVIFHPVYWEEGVIMQNQPGFLIKEVNNNTWVHPYGGGFSYYDPEEETLIPMGINKDCITELFSSRLHHMNSDRQGNLWLCARTRALKKITFPKKGFKFDFVSARNNSVFHNHVRGVYEDNSGRTWVATKGGKVCLYDSKHNKIGYLNNNGKIQTKETLFDGSCYSINQDKDGNIWLGTKGNGLYKLTKNKGELSFTIKNYHYEDNNPYSISNNNIYDIHFDKFGRMWVATYDGGINIMETLPEGNVRFINLHNELSGYANTKALKVRQINSNSSTVFIASVSGLITCPLDSTTPPQNLQFTKYNYQKNDSACLSNNDVHFIKITKDGDIYLATFGGGLNKLVDNGPNKPYSFEHYTTEDGISSDILLAISEDQNNNLWMVTETGLCKFYTDKKVFENYNNIDFGSKFIFSEASTVEKKNGEILFGCNKGLLYFHPDSIYKNPLIPPVVFKEFRLFNKRIEAGSQLLPHPIDYTDTITLNHKENVFSLEFCALEMKNPKKVQYAYKLEGFEKKWNYIRNNRIANYTNIPHGIYTFKVKSTNGDGVWGEAERTIVIKILPSFWQTAWAYAIYIILFIAFSGIALYILKTIYNLKMAVKVESKLSKLKLEFFTDISHELRTPLTLIAGPIEHLLQNNSMAEKDRSQLEIVNKNTSRMLELINQLLDFAKLSHHRMKIRAEKIILEPFIKEIMDNFNLLAIEKNIAFKLHSSNNRPAVWADKIHLEKIIFNLLSNSFKYTNQGKSIDIIIEDTDRNINITIKDSGIGMDEAMLENLFNNHETKNSTDTKDSTSTGIGLSVVKQLVQLQKGKIVFDSKKGEGTSLTIILQKGISHFSPETNIIFDENSGLKQKAEPSKKIEIGDYQPDEDQDKLNILVVDDSEDIRSFLSNILSTEFKINEASNGEDGLNLAKEIIPDLIICDWMMPKLNGIEFLKELRSDINISHIPFIMLSAKTGIEDQLKGLEGGADDYIPKPFSSSLLLAKVSTLIGMRERARDYFTSNDSSKLDINPEQPQVQSLDKQFMDDLMEIMEKNIENSSLVVEDLVDKMGLSRSVFYKKLKSLTGLSPVEFIKEVRLKRAEYLIKNSDYNISQIAFMVGMNDPRYFARCFKQKYGSTPSNYRGK